MGNLKVFVIIVTYNGKKWYKRCFDSLRTSLIDISIVVIDNMSSDGTIGYIKENYPEVIIIENSRNLGFGKANNIGLSYAMKNGADFMFLLNQDSWVYPNTISTLVSSMIINKNYGILSPLHLNSSERELDFKFSKYLLANEIEVDSILYNDTPPVLDVAFINAAFWLVSSSCINTVGGFLPLFPHYGEDNNFAKRCLYHGLKIGVIPGSKAIHDREQNDDDIFGLSNEKLYRFYFVNYLKFLTDINVHLAKACLLWFRFMGIMMTKSFYKLGFRSLRYCFLSFLDVVIEFPQIIKARKVTKTKGMWYLQ